VRTSQRRQHSQHPDSERHVGGGQPLDSDVRAYFEPLLGHDFSRVRIHADSAQPSVVGAAAVTVGDELTFAPGWFDPASARGRRLLAHELTHVVQHDRFGTQGEAESDGVASRASHSEREAEAAADTLAAGRPVAVHAAPAAAVAPGVLDWIEDTVSDVGSAIGDAASSVGSFVGDAASSVGSAVSDAASGAWDFTKDVGSTIYGGMKSAAGGIHKATEWATDGIDWLEDKASSGAHWLADKAEGIPVLEQLASGGAWLVDESTQITGGVLKGATSLAGGVLSMAANPVDTAVGLERMAEHVSIPGIPNPLKALHGLYNVAAGDESWGELANNTFNPVASMEQDAKFFGQMGKALIAPYQQSIEKGKYGDALGRGLFDALAFIGTGGESAAAEAGVEGLSVASRIGEAGELAKGTEALEAANAASNAGKATEALEAANVAGDAGKATDVVEAVGGTGGGGAAGAGDLAAVKPPGKQVLDPWPLDLGPEPPLAPHQVRMELPQSGLTPGTEEALAEGLKGPGVSKPPAFEPGSAGDRSFEGIAESTAPAPKPPIPKDQLGGSTLRELGERPADFDLGATADEAMERLENMQLGRDGPLPGAEGPILQTEGPVLHMPLHESPLGPQPPSMLEVGAGPADVNTGWPVSIQEDPVGGMIDRVRTDFGTNVREGVESLNGERPDFSQLSRPVEGRMDTVLVNNPRGYNPNLGELSGALNENGRIIVQGRGKLTPAADIGELSPEMRGDLIPEPLPADPRRVQNPNFQNLLEGAAPEGLTKVGAEPMSWLDEMQEMLQGLMPEPFDPLTPPPPNYVRPDMIGREFWRTDAANNVFPNSRVVYRR
jgi:hypothetical protein